VNAGEEGQEGRVRVVTPCLLGVLAGDVWSEDGGAGQGGGHHPKENRGTQGDKASQAITTVKVSLLFV
jgi:hypothetical protein